MPSGATENEHSLTLARREVLPQFSGFGLEKHTEKKKNGPGVFLGTGSIYGYEGEFLCKKLFSGRFFVSSFRA